jgi:phosphate:Na+ symporter
MLIQEVLALEDEIDALQRTFEANHVRRLENKICSPLLGIVFVDILRNLERIADHSTNIANAILLGF